MERSIGYLKLEPSASANVQGLPAGCPRSKVKPVPYRRSIA